ncbi:(2Fe-2S)-binding protein [Fervidicoccus fontis]|uniref:SoxA A3 domain-containing protein n=1 Tax=Fervidicoccus fontis (strain DSM 19380 / JCM 18336 / VKM B-2539 / Kam940) TaxID=1163730 RepID=I0A2L8_FERFK|nr:(2Fe-2S)-binding protein [Fervidicoccus fontis]AFH43225.1 hypothetical protein FFONT_1237 [Fervidicoccus fontis Kam940]
MSNEKSFSLFEKETIPVASSPKFKRPRAPFYMESWCPWIRVHAQPVFYLYDPRISQSPSPKIGSSLSTKIRKKLGQAGFYHSFLVRSIWSQAWKKIVSYSENPELPNIDSEYENTEIEEVKKDFLILGDEGDAITFANFLYDEAKGSILMISSKSRKELENESKETLNDSVEFYTGLYLGKFDDGFVFLNKEKKKILKIDAKSFVIYPGFRDSFPIFENNDLPGIIGSSLAIKLLVNKGLLKEIKKVTVLIGNDERGYEVANEISKYKDTTIVDVKNNVKEIKAFGYPKIEGIIVDLPSGIEKINTDLLVSAVSFIPNIEPALQLGGNIVYSSNLNTITVHTKNGEIVGNNNMYFLGQASGTPKNLVKEEAEIAAKLASGKSLSTTESSKLAEIQKEKNLIDPNEVIVKERPVFILTSNTKGMKFVCPCQDVTLEDLIKAFDMGFSNLEEIKRFTALGTGTCQGRICRIAALHALSYFRNVPIGSIGNFRQRAPLVPVEIEYLR